MREFKIIGVILGGIVVLGAVVLLGVSLVRDDDAAETEPDPVKEKTKEMRMAKTDTPHAAPPKPPPAPKSEPPAPQISLADKAKQHLVRNLDQWLLGKFEKMDRMVIPLTKIPLGGGPRPGLMEYKIVAAAPMESNTEGKIKGVEIAATLKLEAKRGGSIDVKVIYMMLQMPAGEDREWTVFPQ